MNKKTAWIASFILTVVITAIIFWPRNKTLTESQQVTVLGVQISESEIRVRELRLEKQDLTNKLNLKDTQILRELGSKTALESKKNKILMSGLNYMQQVQPQKVVVIETGVQKTAEQMVQEHFTQEQ